MNADRRLHAPRVEAVHPYTPFGDDELDQSIPERFEKQVLIHPDRLGDQVARRVIYLRGIESHRQPACASDPRDLRR